MGENKKLLVVEDEAQITRVLRRGLESAGYQVRVANDGRSGLETFRACSALDVGATILSSSAIVTLALTAALCGSAASSTPGILI
jgi:DNA-binding response OmpR family regulator